MNTLLDVIGSLATIITILSFFSGISICRHIYTKKSTNDVNSLPFLVGTLCGYLWLRYGLMLVDRTMIFVNTIGFTMQSCYLLWFYAFTKNRTQINRRILFLLLALAAIHVYINVSTGPDDLIGSLASLSSMFFCLSPLPSVSEALQIKSTEKLPFPLIFSSFLVSTMWFCYGYLIDNPFVQVPNGVGALISSLQLSLFLIYPSNPKSSSINDIPDKDKLLN